MSDPPNESEAAFLKAIGDRSEHETAEAERELRVFLARRPDSFEGQLLLGWICFRRSGFEDMVAALSRAVTLDSSSAQAWSYLGTGYFYQGRLSDAVEAFNAALAVKESPSELTRLGCCLHRLGRTEEAIAAYRRALRLLPAAGRRQGSYKNFRLMRALR